MDADAVAGNGLAAAFFGDEEFDFDLCCESQGGEEGEEGEGEAHRCSLEVVVERGGDLG